MATKPITAYPNQDDYKSIKQGALLAKQSLSNFLIQAALEKRDVLKKENQMIQKNVETAVAVDEEEAYLPENFWQTLETAKFGGNSQLSYSLAGIMLAGHVANDMSVGSDIYEGVVTIFSNMRDDHAYEYSDLFDEIILVHPQLAEKIPPRRRTSFIDGFLEYGEESLEEYC